MMWLMCLWNLSESPLRHFFKFCSYHTVKLNKLSGDTLINYTNTSVTSFKVVSNSLHQNYLGNVILSIYHKYLYIILAAIILSEGNASLETLENEVTYLAYSCKPRFWSYINYLNSSTGWRNLFNYIGLIYASTWFNPKS